MEDLKPWEKAAKTTGSGETKPWEKAALKKKESTTEPASGGLTSLNGSNPFQTQQGTDVPIVLTPEKQAEARQANAIVNAKKEALSERLKGYSDVYRATQGDAAADDIENAPVQQGVIKTPDKPLSFTESVSNSVSNLATSLKGTLPRLSLLAGEALEKTIGKELTGQLSALPRLEFSGDGVEIHTGRTPEDIRDQAIRELDALSAQTKRTTGLVESASDFNVPGLAAGVIDAVGSLAGTIIPAAASGGSLLVTDMVGGSLYDYNSAKAKSKGLTTQELFDKGEADFGVPAALGGVAFGLEMIGLKGVKNAMNAKLRGPAAKKAAALFIEWNKEGATELVQTGLDAANRAVGEGKSAEDAAKIAVDEMFSKKGLESYLMGIVGSGVAGGMGRLVKTVTSPKRQAAVAEKVAEIERMSSEIVNPEATPETKAFIESQIRTSVGKIAEEISKDADETEKLGAEQKREIDEITSKIAATETVVADPAASPETKALAIEANTSLNEELETKLKEKPKKTELDKEIEGKENGTIISEEELSNADEITSPEALDVGEQAGDGTGMGEGNAAEEITGESIGETIQESEVPPLNIERLVYEEEAPVTEEIPVVEQESQTPASEERGQKVGDSVPVLSKAEDDLSALKKVTNKAVKYEASMKRLSEAKAAGLITETEFNDTKSRFDDVMAESSGKAGDSLRKLADKIDQGKINKMGQFTASTGFDAVWDGSLTVVSASLRAGAKVADAIEAGLENIRQTDWYKNLKDKQKFEDTYRAHVGGQLKDKEEAPAPPAPKKEAPKPKQEDDGMSKRAATQRVLNSDKYSQEFKDAITEKTIYYKELPNKITDEEAEAIIDTRGESEAVRATSDFNNGMPSAVRFSVLQKLIDRLEARGEHLEAAELAEDLYSKATDYGQGIQIFSTFPKLSKAANVAMAKKTVATQREKLAKRAKPTTTKITKEFKKANEEAAEETVKAVKKSVEKATKVAAAATITDLPAGYGTKNKVFTRDKYLKAKMNLRKSLHSFAGGVPIEDLINIAGYHMEATGRDFERFTRRMKADLGAKIKPYLKDIYGQTRKQLVDEGYDESLFLSDKEIDDYLNAQEGEKLKAKLEKALAKKDAKEQKEAIAKLQQISKEEGVWGQYRDSAASRLKNMVKTNIQADIEGDPSLQQFTDGLVKNMRQKMQELQPEQPKTKAVPRPDIEVIGDAYKNVEKYKDVWDKTQQEFQDKYADDPDILDAIDGYFGEILDKPFSDRILTSAVRKGLREMDKTIESLVVQHYTVVDHAKESLKTKLVNEAGLNDAEAITLAAEIERKFDEIATKKKQQILDRMFSKKTRKAHQAKGVDAELIKLTNLGGFSSAAIVEAYGEKMGWPKLTQENIDRIELLSDIIQNTNDPINKRRATEDLLAYQASLKGTSPWDIPTAIWYANILSGYNTQLINFGANGINTGLLFANAVAQRPTDAPFIAKGLLEGLKRGWLEGKDTFKTGYSPIKGRPEVPPLLERVTFKGGDWNPASYLKFVRRMMVAADVIFFEGQKEMRAYQMAAKQARKEGRDNPTLDQIDRAIEIVGRASGQLQAIQDKYDAEHSEEVARIEDQNDLSASDKSALIKALDSDKQRKIFDAIEQQRSTEMIEGTVAYASEGTYNYQPRGLLGVVANGINRIIESVPALRYAVPFTNIIANVANETINYSPLAFTRLKTGGWTSFRREELTEQQRADLMTKAIIGTGLMVAAMVLSQPLGDDDEPFLEITSNGTGDYAKNETLKQTGWQPYSFRVKLPGGNYSSWFSYQYSPLILSLGYVGHFNDLRKYKKEDDNESIAARLSKAAGLSTSSFFQATYLNGLSEFMSTVLDPRSSEGLIDKMVKGTMNAVRGLVLPNFYTQAAQDYERYFDVPKKEIRAVKDVETPKDYVKTLLAKTLQDIPYARNMFYDKINILGDPIMYDTDKFESSGEPDKIIDLLIGKKAVFAPMNRNAEKIYDTVKERERALTDEEFYNYSKQKGAYIKKALTDGYDKYSKMGEETFKKELSKIKAQATKSAKALVGDIPATTLEIQEGDVTYSLTPQQIKRRLDLIKEFTEMNRSNFDDPIELRKAANTHSKDMMLNEGYAPDAEGAFKLEIKD